MMSVLPILIVSLKCATLNLLTLEQRLVYALATLKRTKDATDGLFVLNPNPHFHFSHLSLPAVTCPLARLVILKRICA
jgi:hypothetical protein